MAALPGRAAPRRNRGFVKSRSRRARESPAFPSLAETASQGPRRSAGGHRTGEGVAVRGEGRRARRTTAVDKVGAGDRRRAGQGRSSHRARGREGQRAAQRRRAAEGHRRARRLAAAAEPVVEETARGRATKAALKGEVECPEERHRLRKTVLFLGFSRRRCGRQEAAVTAERPGSRPRPAAATTARRRPVRRPRDRGTEHRPGRRVHRSAFGSTSSPPTKSAAETRRDAAADDSLKDTKPETRLESKPDTKPDTKPDIKPDTGSRTVLLPAETAPDAAWPRDRESRPRRRRPARRSAVPRTAPPTARRARIPAEPTGPRYAGGRGTPLRGPRPRAFRGPVHIRAVLWSSGCRLGGRPGVQIGEKGVGTRL